MDLIKKAEKPCTECGGTVARSTEPDGILDSICLSCGHRTYKEEVHDGTLLN